MDDQSDLHESLERLARELDEDPEAVPFAALEVNLRAAAEEIINLERALETRGEIGRAQGILIERFGIDAERAFALLVRLSQHSNRNCLISVASSLRPVSCRATLWDEVLPGRSPVAPSVDSEGTAPRYRLLLNLGSRSGP